MKPYSGPALFLGTSGWYYPHWRQSFYQQTSRQNWLSFYAQHFNAVEVNASFYRHLSTQTLQHWLDITPATFKFTLKGHRSITHHKRLRDAAAAIAQERSIYQQLNEKLAAVVWQCPANFQRQLTRLESFCHALVTWPEVRHAIEFRHASWFCAEVADCLHQHGIAVCLSDAADWPLWQSITTDLIYIRLHGHSRTYASAYHSKSLAHWQDKITRWLADGLTVHVYFDNDAEGAAPHDAQCLLKLIKMHSEQPPGHSPTL